MLGILKEKSREIEAPDGRAVALYASRAWLQDARLAEQLGRVVAPCSLQCYEQAGSSLAPVQAVVALYPAPDALARLAQAVRDQRSRRRDGLPVLVVVLAPEQLTEFGGWLAASARADEVHGLRLLVHGDSGDPGELAQAVGERLAPVTQASVIAVPTATEAETGQYDYFFCLSPELRGLLDYVRELAENNIPRIYLLGGPGAGKTLLAWYYYRSRARGCFVTVNLAAEASDDKAATKSRLCGQVSGAFAGAESRAGAFLQARDGVCFLDEAHRLSGPVMDVLMETLDCNQYLPHGASARRPLDCSLVFASNRRWGALVAASRMDEHARLGAMVVSVPDLAARREDLVAVLAATLDRMRRASTSWVAPAGLSMDAWQAVCACPWRGNARALIRVIETAFVTAATRRAPLIERAFVENAMALWEPQAHPSHALYASDSPQ